MDKPIIGTAYRHKNGIVYTPILFTNLDSTNPQYEPTVIYVGPNGKTWSRSIESFNSSFTLAEIERSSRIILNAHEIQSGCSRVHFAEGLIRQLPVDHEGRGTWLMNYGKGEEGDSLRKEKGIKFDYLTESAETVGS